jgi:hypothetical protein
MMSEGFASRTEVNSLTGRIRELRFVHRLSATRVHVLRAGLDVTFLLVVLVNLSFAEDVNHFTLNIGGGLTTINGREAVRLDHGGNFQFGAGLQLHLFVWHHREFHV